MGSIAVARPPTVVTIATPAFTAGWPDDVARALTQLVVLRQDRAEIHVHPADLGPITVRIHIEGGQANLLIQAPQPATRDGLELALPLLRESLAQQGITLGEASVRDERAPGQGAASHESRHAAIRSADDASAIAAAPLRTRLGLVDLFA